MRVLPAAENQVLNLNPPRFSKAWKAGLSNHQWINPGIISKEADSLNSRSKRLLCTFFPNKKKITCKIQLHSRAAGLVISSQKSHDNA